MGKNKRSEESEGTGASGEQEQGVMIPEAPTSTTETRRPIDWRQDCGVPRWAHAASSTVHGWKEHRYHAGKPLQVTRDNYLAAIAAANDNTGELVPHGPALSEHKGKGL